MTFRLREREIERDRQTDRQRQREGEDVCRPLSLILSKKVVELRVWSAKMDIIWYNRMNYRIYYLFFSSYLC